VKGEDGSCRNLSEKVDDIRETEGKTLRGVNSRTRRGGERLFVSLGCLSEEKSRNEKNWETEGEARKRASKERGAQGSSISGSLTRGQSVVGEGRNRLKGGTRGKGVNSMFGGNKTDPDYSSSRPEGCSLLKGGEHGVQSKKDWEEKKREVK